MLIYVASSWKNPLYDSTTAFLKEFGHSIADWKINGFGWSQVTEVPKENFTGTFYRDVILRSTRAEEGFKNDAALMKSADCCVLLLPCGRSAHLEAGWFAGRKKPLHIFIPVFEEPELMYKFAHSISFTLEELEANLAAR